MRRGNPTIKGGGGIWLYSRISPGEKLLYSKIAGERLLYSQFSGGRPG